MRFKIYFPSQYLQLKSELKMHLLGLSIFGLYCWLSSQPLENAPRPDMTDADWAHHTLQLFYGDLRTIGILGFILFVVNLLRIGSSPQNKKPLLRIFFMRGLFVDSLSKRVLKHTIFQIAVWVCIPVFLAIASSAYDNYMTYLYPPPYSSS